MGTKRPLALYEGKVKELKNADTLVTSAYMCRVVDGALISGSVVNASGTTVTMSNPSAGTYVFTFGSVILSDSTTKVIVTPNYFEDDGGGGVAHSMGAVISTTQVKIFNCFINTLGEGIQPNGSPNFSLLITL